jgi:hypothetical protein
MTTSHGGRHHHGAEPTAAAKNSRFNERMALLPERTDAEAQQHPSCMTAMPKIEMNASVTENCMAWR